uniref:protein TIFY 7-like n=1 Tax=Erigeron canadensis TaxID=72917 RepID=UPI001CB89ACD|nr:protein TIFY 7-like [Erigeron canadensis]XP_043640035.1 protein TIFY 7-like [Erigeron canadensis]
MERDFMGLNSKDTVLKKEDLTGCKEAYGFKAFNHHQEGKFQAGAHFMQLHSDAKQAVPTSSLLGSCLFTPQFYGAPAVKPHLLGVPVASHPVYPFTGSSFYSRKTQPWCGSKVDSAQSQLTIFYGGLVNVYDNISPKEAQAIMLMAGNWRFLSSGTTPKPRPVQAHGYRPSTPAVDEAYLSRPTTTQPCSAVSSPMSVSSHPVGQASGSRPTNKTEETKKLLSSLGHAIQSVFPQARKASLARFLEKRKERGLASAPYSLSKSINYAANSDDVVNVSK